MGEDTIGIEIGKNNINPRQSPDAKVVALADRRGGYNIKAGPVPADAGPSCQYEWSLKVRADSEEDMYQFVTMLRQCVRMDHFQQVQRLRETASKPAPNQSSMYDMALKKTSSGGSLEVVLVEARR